MLSHVSSHPLAEAIIHKWPAVSCCFLFDQQFVFRFLRLIESHWHDTLPPVFVEGSRRMADFKQLH